jgi:hypothetical protein
VIREFHHKDREAIRDIARSTGQKGNPTSTFFEDEEVIPMVFADYYIEYEPESCFVAEADGRVVGYMLGCKNTRNYNRIMLLKIGPRLMVRIVWKILTLQYRRKQTYRTLLWALTKAAREMPRAAIDRYPAHVHINIEAGFRRGLVGKRLCQTMVTHLKTLGVRAGHATLVEPEDDDSLSRMAQTLFKCRLTDVKRFTCWDKLTNRKWYSKLLVREL